MKSTGKKLLYLSVAVNLLLISFILHSVFGNNQVNANTPLYLKNKNYIMKTSNYNVYKTHQANIVMVGDSITYGVDWHELLGRNDVVNRGIGGDYTEGMLHRLHYIYKLNPKIVFLMGGINDLQWNAASPQKVAQNQKSIVLGLKNHLIKPVITSTLYVSPSKKNSGKINAKVDQLNRMLVQIAKENNVPYIDLNSKLASGHALNPKYTVDGIHLLGDAYTIWGNEITKVLNTGF